MGATSDAGSSVGDASQRAVDKAKGNPLAVGLIAFGVGWLAASLVPASEKEKEIAGNLKDAAQPLVEKVTDAAKEVGENLKEPAQEAFASVKDVATDAVGTVKSEAGSATDDVTGQEAGRISIRPASLRVGSGLCELAQRVVDLLVAEAEPPEQGARRLGAALAVGVVGALRLPGERGREVALHTELVDEFLCRVGSERAADVRRQAVRRVGSEIHDVLHSCGAHRPRTRI
jgi:hypothetical protein